MRIRSRMFAISGKVVWGCLLANFQASAKVACHVLSTGGAPHNDDTVTCACISDGCFREEKVANLWATLKVSVCNHDDSWSTLSSACQPFGYRYICMQSDV